MPSKPQQTLPMWSANPFEDSCDPPSRAPFPIHGLPIPPTIAESPSTPSKAPQAQLPSPSPTYISSTDLPPTFRSPPHVLPIFPSTSPPPLFPTCGRRPPLLAPPGRKPSMKHPADQMGLDATDSTARGKARTLLDFGRWGRWMPTWMKQNNTTPRRRQDRRKQNREPKERRGEIPPR